MYGTDRGVVARLPNNAGEVMALLEVRGYYRISICLRNVQERERG
jgi:hypothetical protein